MSNPPDNLSDPVICQIVAEPYHPGGLEKHFIEMCNGLSRDQAVHAIAHESYRRHLDDTVVFHPLDLSRSRRHPLMLWQLIQLLRSIDARVVHAHAKKAGYMLSRVARFIPQQSVITLHNLTLARPWMKRVDGVICVSKTIADTLPGLPTHVVYNGIATPPPAASFHYPTPKPNVLAAGRLAPAKGFDLLIQAVAEIDNVQLHLAGQGDELARLQAMAGALGITDRVHFLGYRDDLPVWVEAADLVVISSRREGFSYVFAEALLAATPVVSTDVPVPCEFLPQAFIVPIDDAGALRHCIAGALDTLDETRQAQEALFSLGRQTFTLEAMLDNTRAVYRRLSR
ncbi:MAG TPA: glycosyltransferase, partial [Rhodobacteraceae bacterium]|nr:glycosyltransferase [Paracoccaceae bacterium]